MFRHIIPRVFTRRSSHSVEKGRSLETRGQSCTRSALESHRWNEDFEELTRTWCID